MVPAASQLTLQHFIFRSQVLSLYRQFLRTGRALERGQRGTLADLPHNLHRPAYTVFAHRAEHWVLGVRFRSEQIDQRTAVADVHADELVREVRSGFSGQSSVTEIPAIKFHLSEGRQRLKQLQEMLGMQTPRR